jgi:cell division protein FtsL
MIGAGPLSPTAQTARAEPAAAVLVVGRIAAIIAALAAVGIVHVWSHTRVTAAGYRLGELQRTQETLRAQRDRLEVEVATLRAPGRLEEFARTRLKMAPPAAGAVTAGRGGEAVKGRPATGGRDDRPRAAAEPIVVSVNAR